MKLLAVRKSVPHIPNRASSRTVNGRFRLLAMNFSFRPKLGITPAAINALARAGARE
jgi:hypothetical protein